MRKQLLFILSFLFIGIFSFGQTNGDKSYLEIGDGIIESSNPLYTSWNYSWSNFIYTSNDLGEAKTIQKIAFYASKNMAGNAITHTNQKLYLKQTTATTASTSYPDPENNGYTLVWDGTINYPANGPQWMEIDITDFVYDGTSNLSMHWQNNSGNSSYITFYCTSVTGSATNSGSDASFPSGGTAYNSYQDALPNMRVYFESDGPDTPEAVKPLNNSIKVDASVEFKFSLTNATSYDFYLGTSEANLIKVAADVPVSADGDYTYTNESLLQSKTDYFWKVVAKEGANETASPIFKFQTQLLISNFPYECGFEDYWVTFFGDTLSSTINSNYPDSSDWTYDSGWAASINTLNPYQGSFAAKVSSWYPGEEILMTPRMIIPENSQISFFWRNNYFFDKSNNSKTYNTTNFEITTDGGENWIVLEELTPTTTMIDYSYAAFDLSEYDGDDVYFRWRFVETVESNNEYFWLDNIKVSSVQAGAEIALDFDSYNFTEICSGGEASFDMIVRNIGSSDLTINQGMSDGPFETDYTGTIAALEQDTVTVYFRPTTAGSFSNDFTLLSNASTGNATLALSGSAYTPLANLFESFDASNVLPEKWSKIKSAWDLYSDVSINNDYFSAPSAIKMIKLNDSISPLVLVTPGVTNFDVNELSFMAKKNYGVSYAMYLEVGVISNPTDASTFVSQETIELTEEYQKYTVTFETSNTIPYIAFKHGTESPLTSLRIDDISWEAVVATPPNPAVVVSPINGSSNVDIMSSPVLKWANGGGGPTGYRVNFGTNNPPSNIVNSQDFGLDQTSTTITDELEYNTTYYWQVIPYNEYGNCANAPVWSFTSMDDPTITSLPFTEGFNNLTNTQGQSDYPMGWSFEDVHGDNITWDVLMYNPSFPNLVLDQAAMHVAFHYANPKDDYLYTPPIAMEAGVTYKLTFMLHTEMDYSIGQVFNEEIEVKIGTDNNSASMSEDQIVYANVDDEDWKEVTATFTVTSDDDYYLGFHAISPAFYYIIIIDDVKVESLVGINEDIVDSNELIVYPNPNNGLFNIEFNGAKPTGDLKVIDINGREVCTISNDVTFIDIQHLSKGFYQILAPTNRGLFKQKLVIE